MLISQIIVCPDQSRKKARPFGTRESGTGTAQVRHLTIGGRGSGQRIDNYLLARFRSVPKSHIYRIIRSGQVRVNSARVRPSRRLQEGDIVRTPPVTGVSPAPRYIADAEVQRFKRNVIFEDEHFFLVNKPGGCVVHGGSCHSFGLAEISRCLDGEPGFPVLVHRLDKGTSGCLLFAKTQPALSGAQRAFRLQQVKKTYTALVAGRWDKYRSRVSAPLLVRQQEGKEKVVVDEGRGKSAVTDFEVAGYFGNCTLLSVMPRSGRMHQIRVHTAFCGHPVAGDRRYGDFAVNRRFHRLGLRRLFLHASHLQFSCMEREYEFRASVPENLSDLLDRL